MRLSFFRSDVFGLPGEMKKDDKKNVFIDPKEVEELLRIRDAIISSLLFSASIVIFIYYLLDQNWQLALGFFLYVFLYHLSYMLRHEQKKGTIIGKLLTYAIIGMGALEKLLFPNPYTKIFEKIKNYLEDGVITEEELENILKTIVNEKLKQKTGVAPAPTTADKATKADTDKATDKTVATKTATKPTATETKPATATSTKPAPSTKKATPSTTTATKPSAKPKPKPKPAMVIPRPAIRHKK